MTIQPQSSDEHDAPISPDQSGADAAPAETRRVQVVARWNSWVQVHDPADDSLTWVDLSEHGFAPA